jgi:hypothetical protein
MFLEKIGKRAAKLFGMLRMLENQGALDVSGAVASAGKLEVAGADGAYLFEQFYNFFAFHRVRCRRRAIRAYPAVVAHSLKAQTKRVNANVARLRIFESARIELSEFAPQWKINDYRAAIAKCLDGVRGVTRNDRDHA